MKLIELSRLGQSAWCDYISREFIASGELRKWIDMGLLGMTSNPSIFEKSISSSSSYDSKILELIKEGKSLEEIYNELTIWDVRDAADIFSEIYNETNGEDGFISIEVLPKYAFDAEKTIEYAEYIFKKIDRKNILIKVPATREGLIAIKELIKRGININATLIFSKSHYVGVVNAYIDGLKDRLEIGQGGLKDVHSVASVFVSRVDTVVDRILDDGIKSARTEEEIKRLNNLKGKAAVVNSKIIYKTFKDVINKEDFKELRKEGANLQRIVWGSTSTKDPAYSDIKYIEELIGRDTINTIPLQTLEAFVDHGVPRVTLDETIDEAELILKELLGIGIDLEKIGQGLQDEGIKAFSESFDKLIGSIEQKFFKYSHPRPNLRQTCQDPVSARKWK